MCLGSYLVLFLVNILYTLSMLYEWLKIVTCRCKCSPYDLEGNLHIYFHKLLLLKIDFRSE